MLMCSPAIQLLLLLFLALCSPGRGPPCHTCPQVAMHAVLSATLQLHLHPCCIMRSTIHAPAAGAWFKAGPPCRPFVRCRAAGPSSSPLGDEIESVLCAFRSKSKAAKPKAASPSLRKEQGNPAKEAASGKPSQRSLSQPGKPSGGSSNKKPESKPAASSGGRRQASKQQQSSRPQGSLDSNLVLSKKESDRLFEEVSKTLAAKSKEQTYLGDDDLDLELEQLLPTAAGSQELFKGFGAPPKELQDTQPSLKASRPAPAQAPASQPAATKRTLARKQQHQNVPPLRVFLYAADAKQTQEAVDAAGWSQQVVISADLKSAHVVVAVKTAAAGKHNKLQQGERTARNAKVPFACVGRRMSKNNLVLALAPILMSHRAKHGVMHEGALAAAMAAAGVQEEHIAQRADVSARKLEPDWKDRMLAELGMVKGEGFAPKAPAAVP